MVPSGWRKQQVSDICTLQNGNSFKPHQWDTKGLPIIRIQNLNGSNNFNYYSGEVKEKWLVETGQLLFSWAGTKGVSFGPFIWKKERGVLNQHIYKVYAEEHVDQAWLHESLRWVTNKIEAQAHGFKATLLHVQKKDIDNQPILLPPLPEQRKIAKILLTWDKAITTTEKLVETTKQQKKALMQQLLTGKKRLVNPETGKAFEVEWEEVKLSHLFTRITEKNKGQSTNVVTISAQHGLIRQEEFFKKSVASETLDNYFILRKGQFAYNKSYSNGYPMGAIKRLNRYDNAVVTSLYICFELKNEGVTSSCFMEQYFESGLLNKGLTKVAAEGGRAHGLLNVKPTDFMSLQLTIPKFTEQHKIASVLTAADKEIEILEAKLAHFKQEKKALMQQLLTGKRRVKVEEMEFA
ncbi:TPA: restriction endonuclease subunit S [Vibrio parahaemolyticus]|nr:restriction endonuclease subunit S [Vibrio parahaemolyticus]